METMPAENSFEAPEKVPQTDKEAEKAWDEAAEAGSSVFKAAQSKLGKWQAPRWYSDKIMAFYEEVKKNVPEYNNYIRYHALIGSSGDSDLLFYTTDLPEPYSIKSFLANCRKELEEIKPPENQLEKSK